jgi:putative glutamine amidotransferase
VSAPAIGICAAIERVSWGVWDAYEVTLVPRNYVSAVQRAGGLAITLPPDEVATTDPDVLLDRVDALILAGGADIDPAGYGAEPHPETIGTWPDRDRFELALTRRALEREMPVLGICRGMQLLNVALGGTLDQHLPETTGADVHRSVAGSFGDHRVRLRPGTLAARAAGGEEIEVRSHHHQGVDRLGEGLVVSGRSLDDDLVEAIERPDRRFALGVIWHPEEDARSPVIEAVVEAAREGVRA